MTDFRLEIVGDGATVALRPVGTVDAMAAGMLLDAVAAMGGGGSPRLDIQFDEVERFTTAGWEALTHAGLDPDVGSRSPEGVLTP